MNKKWIEVWLDEGLNPPYLLVVMGTDVSPVSVRIIDPHDGGKVLFESRSYEDAKMWLLEDEYCRVEGRVVVCDG